MSVTAPPRICVIGAGPCGLTTIKNLLAAGLDNVICYDDGEAIGGNWVFTDDPNRMSVYELTHLISSLPRSLFEDFPAQPGLPTFPSHREMRAYFESYAAHFKLAPYIRLRSRVEHATLRDDGRWSIRLSGMVGEELFEHLIVCSGHHRVPHMPVYPGRFTGESLHSCDYKRAERFRGKRVLVVGGGNSGCDIVVDVARVARRACLSMRRAGYIVPKVILGRPVDAQYQRAQAVPRVFRQRVLRALLRVAIGPPERYGLPAPSCGPLEMHPTLNSEILPTLTDGTVLPRVGIQYLDGNNVHFRDGKVEAFDSIIWATGFETSLPFLDASVVDWDVSQPPPLYLKMMHPRIPSIYFIGLFQPIGCIWRLADHQARIAALQIAGRLARPADIGRRVRRERERRHWRFDSSRRHALEVDYYAFRRELMAELRAART